MFMFGVPAFGVPSDTSFLPDRVRFLSPSDTRFTMAATIFTAVDTAPRIIRMEDKVEHCKSDIARNVEAQELNNVIADC